MTGTPVESGNRGEGFGADNAFQSEGSWDGKADENRNVWVGQVFDNDVTASCMTVKFGAKFMKTLRVQALIDDEWRNVMINSNGSTGVVSTQWNKQTSSPSALSSVSPSVSSSPSTSSSSTPSRVVSMSPSISTSPSQSLDPTTVPSLSPSATLSAEPSIQTLKLQCGLNQYNGKDSCLPCPPRHSSFGGNKGIAQCIKCPDGMDVRNDGKPGCVVSNEFDATIAVSRGWRIWAPLTDTMFEMGAEVEEFTLYENFDCSGPAINMTGTPVESGSVGRLFRAENAFQSEGWWDGKADENGNIWVGQMFDNDVTASCMTVKFRTKFMIDMRVQALIDDEWRNVMIRRLGTMGVVKIHWNLPPVTASPSMSSSPTSSLSPTMAPLDPISLYMEDILSVTNNVSTLDDLTSPQYQALSWIGNTLRDNNNLDSIDELPHSHTIQQTYILATLFYATNGTEWRNYKTGRSNWMSFVQNDEINQIDICRWDGVLCTRTAQLRSMHSENVAHVSSLSLERNSLQGSLPSELSALTHMKHLSLQSNRITGTIPESFGNLTNLTTIFLERNSLSGTIPGTFGKLDDLERMDLSNNNLSGTFPADMTRLKKLNRLWLSNNKFKGTIPNDIGNMDSLRELRLSNNDFSGTVPNTMGQLTGLESLRLNGNTLSGSIPDPLGNLSKLGKSYYEQ